MAIDDEFEKAIAKQEEAKAAQQRAKTELEERARYDREQALSRKQLLLESLRAGAEKLKARGFSFSENETSVVIHRGDWSWFIRSMANGYVSIPGYEREGVISKDETKKRTAISLPEIEAVIADVLADHLYKQS